MSHQVEGFSCQAIAATSWATGSIPARGFIVGLFVTVNKIVTKLLMKFPGQILRGKKL
jgi:hypothetical protein